LRFFLTAKYAKKKAQSTLSFQMKNAFWKAVAVPFGFASPAPVPAPIKNREYPLGSGLGGRADDTIYSFIANAMDRLCFKEQPAVK